VSSQRRQLSPPFGFKRNGVWCFWTLWILYILLLKFITSVWSGCGLTQAKCGPTNLCHVDRSCILESLCCRDSDKYQIIDRETMNLLQGCLQFLYPYTCTLYRVLEGWTKLNIDYSPPGNRLSEFLDLPTPTKPPWGVIMSVLPSRRRRVIKTTMLELVHGISISDFFHDNWSWVLYRSMRPGDW